MRRARLTQDVIAIERWPTEAAAPATSNQLQETMDCPDCSDTMLKFYDWDCGLTIANPVILSQEVRT